MRSGAAQTRIRSGAMQMRRRSSPDANAEALQPLVADGVAGVTYSPASAHVVAGVRKRGSRQ
jgi:hypothetical protein